MNRYWRRGSICARTLLFAIVMLANAQDRSALTGTVTDEQGARVPEASVRAIHLDTGLERQTLTSSQGIYAMDDLPGGRFSVIFSKHGFSEVRVSQVEQVVGQMRTLDGHLTVSPSSQATTLTEPLVQLERTGAAVGSPIERAQLEELPLNGRN